MSPITAMFRFMHWDHTFTFSLELHFQWFKYSQNFTQLSWFQVLWTHKLHVCIDSYIFGFNFEMHKHMPCVTLPNSSICVTPQISWPKLSQILTLSTHLHSTVHSCIRSFHTWAVFHRIRYSQAIKILSHAKMTHVTSTTQNKILHFTCNKLQKFTQIYSLGR